MIRGEAVTLFTLSVSSHSLIVRIIANLAHGVGETSLHRVEDVVGLFQQPVVLLDLRADVYGQRLERSDLETGRTN